MTNIYTAETAKVIKNWSFSISFPEVKDGFPLHPREIINICPKLVGKTICTLSEHIILWFLREVRDGRIKPEEINIRLVAEDGKVRLMRIDQTGEFLDPWPNGFFEERGELLFM